MTSRFAAVYLTLALMPSIALADDPWTHSSSNFVVPESILGGQLNIVTGSYSAVIGANQDNHGRSHVLVFGLKSDRSVVVDFESGKVEMPTGMSAEEASKLFADSLMLIGQGWMCKP